MERILTPRGGGRTYRVCKYAIEHDCDIIVPTIENIKHCFDTLKKICDNSDGQYFVLAFGGNGAPMTDGIGFRAVTIKTIHDETITIRIYTAYGFLHRRRGTEPRNYIADDADECLGFIFGPQLVACSMMTYDPAEVELKPTTPQNECYCESLL